jgi:hypothetical protein
MFRYKHIKHAVTRCEIAIVGRLDLKIYESEEDEA